MIILPASWHYDSDLLEPQLEWVSLDLSNSTWIYSGRFPLNYPFEFWELLNRTAEHWVIRGVRPELFKMLQAHGQTFSVYAGEELLIDLRHLKWRDSLIRLKKRAETKGKFVPLHVFLYRDLLHHFFTRMKKEKGILLKYLFSYEISPPIVGFIYVYQEEIYALVTASQAGSDFWQVELMLRLEATPTGAMEGLILTLAEYLKGEGAGWLSLGECPFVGQPNRLITSIYFVLGRRFRFLYDYKGLYAFKRKFTPYHQPLYWVANHPLTLVHFVDLFHKSGFIQLLWKKFPLSFIREIKFQRKKRGATNCPSPVVFQ